MARHNRAIEDSLQTLRERQNALEEPVRARLLESKIAQLPEELRSHTGRALQTKPDQREPAQKQLAEKYEKSLRPTATEIEAALSAQEKAALAGIADETNRLHHSRRTWGRCSG